MYLVVIKFCNNNICAVVIIRQHVAQGRGVYTYYFILTTRQTQASVLCPLVWVLNEQLGRVPRI